MCKPREARKDGNGVAAVLQLEMNAVCMGLGTHDDCYEVNDEPTVGCSYYSRSIVVTSA